MGGITKVGVVGAYGNMGSHICAAVEAAEGMELVAKVGHSDPLAILGVNDADVVVDVTSAEAAKKNLPWFALHEMHAVVGTSGSVSVELDASGAAVSCRRQKCFVVPNFSASAPF